MRASYSRIGFTAAPFGVIRVSALSFESYPRGSPHRKSNLELSWPGAVGLIRRTILTGLGWRLAWRVKFLGVVLAAMGAKLLWAWAQKYLLGL